MNDLEIKEAYCIKNGWEKIKGFLVNAQIREDDYDFYFVEEDEVRPCYFWRDAKGDDENAFEDTDIDDLIERIDDYKDEDDGDETFEKFKSSHKEDYQNVKEKKQ